MSLVDVPADVPDGTYRLDVVDVQRTWTDGTRVETAVARLSGLGDEAGSGTEHDLLVPGADLPDPVAPGALYRVRVVDGELCHAERDWERAVRRQAPTVGDDRFVLPLERARERLPGTLASPAMATVDANKSLLVTGEPGAGKTEAIRLLLNQIRVDDDMPVVVFSYKDDYVDWAADRDDVVRLSLRDSSHVHNVFEEVPAGATDREAAAEFEEIARLLTEPQRDGNNKRFFPDAAGRVLAAIMTYLQREGERVNLPPDNREIVDFVGRFDHAEMYDLLGEHEDLRGSAGSINPEASKQAVGVVSTLQIVVQDAFAGDFGVEPGDRPSISVREYMERPDGRVLLLDFPIERPRRAGGAFRMLLERAIDFGLRDRNRACFVLDEFARLPEVENVETLVDTGRARNAQAILGLQSVSQLDDRYGVRAGDAIRSGMLYELHLRAGDARTVEYVTHRLGGERTVTTHERGRTGDESDPSASTGRSVRGPAFPTDLQELPDGEGYLVTPRGVARVALPMFDDLVPATRRALTRREPTTDGSTADPRDGRQTRSSD